MKFLKFQREHFLLFLKLTGNTLANYAVTSTFGSTEAGSCNQRKEAMSELIVPAAGPLLVGLVAPIGVDVEFVKTKIVQAFSKFGYRVQFIKLSDFLKELSSSNLFPEITLNSKDCYLDNTEKLMNIGDRARKETGCKGFLAYMAAARIFNESHTHEKISITSPVDDKIVWVIDSIKNPGEIELFKEIYSDAFLPVAIYSPLELRIKQIRNRARKNRSKEMSKDETELRISKLLQRDQFGGENGFGQDVRDAFALAEAFIDVQDPSKAAEQTERVIDLWFSHPFHTPTIEEFGMFLAFGASLKSADLSRQVGAAILTERGEIISIGYNEVPKPGGGSYWEGDKDDQRDFKFGVDANAQYREEIYQEIVTILGAAGFLNKSAGSNTAEIAEALFHGDIAQKIKNARIANLIEFGRIVHAEMTAITESARKGLSLRGTTLICTTYPCHMCARHIIASGIKKVVYIEPYPKSLTQDLYKDMLSTERLSPNEKEPSPTNTVAFLPFIGVGPRRYIEFFEMPRRKNTEGIALDWKPTEQLPRLKRHLVDSIIDQESLATEKLRAYMDKLKQKPETTA